MPSTAALSFVLCLLSLCVLGVDILGKVDLSREEILNLEPDTKVVIQPGQRYTFVKPDGTFQIKRVPEGLYTLEVLATAYTFHRYVAHVTEAGVVFGPHEPSHVISVPTAPPTTDDTGAALPDNELNVRLRFKNEFFNQEGSFNVLASLMSPMTLMMLVSLGMMLFLPRIMESMEKDLKAERGHVEPKSTPLMDSFVPLSERSTKLNH